MVGLSEWLIILIALALLFPSIVVGIVAYFVGYKRGVNEGGGGAPAEEAASGASKDGDGRD